MEYFLFELNGYALPGFASGTSLYLGTKSDFRNLLRNNDMGVVSKSKDRSLN